MAGVEAEVHQLRVGVGQEALDPVLGVDMGVGVRVEDQLHAVLAVDHLGELVGAGHQVLPLLGVEVAGLGGRTGVLVGVLLGQVHEVLGADRGQQLGLLAELGDRLVQRVLALVQSGEDGATADGEVALGQLFLQLCGVLRHEALRPELGVDVAHGGDLVQVDVPRHLVRVAGEPDAPRVRRGAEAKLGEVGHGGLRVGVVVLRG